MHLAPIATHWNVMMGIDVRYPEKHADFLTHCHEAWQCRPTLLLLQYKEGDYNSLHQDLYGEHVFPIQVTILLSEPGRNFQGGEFVQTEQRPRMQSRLEVVPLRQGRSITVQSREHVGSIGSICAMASVAFVVGTDRRSASFFMTQPKEKSTRRAPEAILQIVHHPVWKTGKMFPIWHSV
jgi:hypothetical protein